jgi:lytic cellulose monooxygenase (C1-hydroxylating)
MFCPFRRLFNRFTCIFLVQSSKAVRATKSDSGFIDDVTCPEITCSVGNNPLPSQNVTAPVAAGGSIEILWNSCPLGYFGPVMNFLTKCPGTCSQYKGDDGDVWVKFQQETCANGTWASDNLANNHHSYTVNIPSRLEPGEYLLLHEILALHGGGNIGGARLYPVCIQLTITSNGTTSLPSAVALPGNYTLTDPGIHFSSYYGDATNQVSCPFHRWVSCRY